MSLKAFHLIFVTLLTGLSFGCAAWAFQAGAAFWGVVAAALLVGVVRGLTSYFLPPASEASMYMLMVLVLLFRPRGLFGERILKFE